MISAMGNEVVFPSGTRESGAELRMKHVEVNENDAPSVWNHELQEE